MDIVICEDDLVQLERVKKTIENYAMMEDNGMEVVLATNNPDDVLSFLKSGKADCYFLDIDLNHEMTGIALGSQIRETDPIASMVFITTHAEMSYLTFIYKLAALDFIIKDNPDILKEKLLSTLKEAHRRYLKIGEQDTIQKLQIKTNGRIQNIDFQNIYFFEASPDSHKIILHLENEHIEFYGRLKNYEDLHSDFYRCHKSFIVNKSKIQNIDSKERVIFLDNGEVCYASARLIKGLLK
ncbi:two-component system response regulator AgrA [Metabacillus crassostreae]|uniref:LytR/AlgR family response regulator transcription factor n=1 Tax=Metabacillus crassostreae TaxID=929098 RepID=UPI00195B07E9|nr:LytTR family DNA-binding domain-containing protein [Metabacillus crassostreae]MBM7606620.1 two-component system response regulator AgrA [Metabacillus crassostreae]